MPVTVVVLLCTIVKWNLSICAHRHGNHNLQRFCSFMHQTSVGSLQHSPIPPSWTAWGHPSRIFPRWGLSQFHTNPASGSVYPTIHTCILSWLHHCMVESTYNMLCTPRTRNLATGLGSTSYLLKLSQNCGKPCLLSFILVVVMQSINRQVFNLVLLEYRCSGQDPATFSVGCEEENAIRYASGYVAMKIMKEFQKKKKYKGFRI